MDEDGDSTDPTTPADPRQEIGQRGELLAAKHLRDEGWTIRDRNVEFDIGELDIVATREETLADRAIQVVAFVEVKTRSEENDIPPEANITRRKRRKLVQLGKLYLQIEGLDEVSARFDVVAVRLHSDPPDVAHYPAAFDSRTRFN